MKKVKFIALDMEVLLPGDSYYFDDGFVDDLKDHTKFLDRNYKAKEPAERLGLVVGLAYQLHNSEGRFAHIYYLNLGNFWDNVRNIAHEETHALKYLGGLPYLQIALNHHGYGLNLHDIDDEMCAHVGSWYSLILRGEDLKSRFIFNKKDRKVLKMLMKSRNNRTA